MTTKDEWHVTTYRAGWHDGYEGLPPKRNDRAYLDGHADGSAKRMERDAA